MQVKWSEPPREKGGKRLQTKRAEPLEKKRGERLQIQQRKTHGKPRGVMAAAILLAVSTAVVAGVTFGWYDLLRETQAGEVVLQSESQLVSVDGFKLFNSSNVESGLSDGNTLTLKSYDSVFGKNSETPVYILIPVGGEAVRQSGYDLEFSFDCGSDTLMEGDKIKPLFSNVAQLRCVTVDDPSVLTSYKAARDQFYMEDGSAQPGVSASKCFAYFTVDSDTHEVSIGESGKSSIVSLSAPGHSDTGVQYVLFELDYNAGLMTGFVNNHASDTSGRLDLSQQISFVPDTFNITVSASQTS